MPASVHPPALGVDTCIQVGTLDKKQFPNTQIVVKGNLVAVVDPEEYTAIETASLVARTTKWSDLGRPSRKRQPLRRAAQARLDLDAPVRTG